MTPEEEWRPVVGYDGIYAVSNLGRVKSFDTYQLIPANKKQKVAHYRSLKGRFLKPSGSGLQKRPMVGLHKDGKCELKKVYHLVLEAFVGPRPDGSVACHNDGDVNNSALSNLRWDTQKSNLEDTKRHGTHLRGSKCYGAKFTEKEAVEIRTAYAKGGVTQYDLADAYGVTQSVISEIVRRKKWAWAEQDMVASRVPG